jgi:GTP cyclohydrolase I
MVNDNILSQLEEEFQKIIFEILQLDQNGVPLQHVKDTPKRIAKMLYNELLAGCYMDPPKLTVFENTNDNHSCVTVKNMEVKSMCSHHFMPFFGICNISYIPDQKVAGLSKFSRIVTYFSARPQIQEELTKQIVDYLNDKLEPLAIGARLDCRHTCMYHRGAKSNGTMQTEYIIVKDKADIKLKEMIRQEIYV